MATKKTKPPTPDPFEALYLSDDQLHEYERQRAAQVEQERKVKPAFQLPVVPHVFAHVAAQPPAPAPRQPLGAAEAAAWRHVVHVLSKTASPTKREIMSDNVDGFIHGRSAYEPGIELADVATLFHPDSPEDAAAVLAALQQACEADALPSDGDCVHLSQLAAWPDIPAPAADSPLRFWLTFLPKAAAPVLELVKPSQGSIQASDDATNDVWWRAWADNRNKANTTLDGVTKKGRARLAWTDADLEIVGRRFSMLKQRGLADAAAKTALGGDLKSSVQAIGKTLKKCSERQSHPSNQFGKKVN